MEGTEQPEGQSRSTRLSSLTGAAEHAFSLEPTAQERAEIADTLAISAVKKLRFSGSLRPDGARDWRLEAVLGATVVQPCVSSMDPVTTRIDAKVVRRYLADPPPLPDGAEIEVPEDDTIEALPEVLDLWSLMLEALDLHLPQYPRAAGIEPSDHAAAPPGEAPLTETDSKPFASLAALRARMDKDGDV